MEVSFHLRFVFWVHSSSAMRTLPSVLGISKYGTLRLHTAEREKGISCLRLKPPRRVASIELSVEFGPSHLMSLIDSRGSHLSGHFRMVLVVVRRRMHLNPESLLPSSFIFHEESFVHGKQCIDANDPTAVDTLPKGPIPERIEIVVGVPRDACFASKLETAADKKLGSIDVLIGQQRVAEVAASERHLEPIGLTVHNQLIMMRLGRPC